MHARVSQLLARGGLARRELAPHEILDIEPTLAGDYCGGFFTESDSTGNIHKFTHGLAQAATRKGVTCHYGVEVTHVSADGKSVHIGIRNNDETSQERFDSVVICAGVGSRNIAARLGDIVNVYPVKGYSITVNLDDEQSQHCAPNVSLLDDEAKLVTSRLGIGRFGVAGTAEFNGVNRDIRADRITPLVSWVEKCYPGVSTRNVVPWAGLRPMMPNKLPRVGPGRSPGVFYNTGQGHLGWTLSAATAESIADVIAAATHPSKSAISEVEALGTSGWHPMA